MDKQGTPGKPGTLKGKSEMAALGLLPGMLSRRQRKAPKAKTPEKLTTGKTFLSRYKSYYKMQKIGHGLE